MVPLRACLNLQFARVIVVHGIKKFRIFLEFRWRRALTGLAVIGLPFSAFCDSLAPFFLKHKKCRFARVVANVRPRADGTRRRRWRKILSESSWTRSPASNDLVVATKWRMWLSARVGEFLSSGQIYIWDNKFICTSRCFQIRMYNRYCSAAERIEFMGWINEGVRQQASKINVWNAYELIFFAIKGSEVFFFVSPPVSTTFYLFPPAL